MNVIEENSMLKKSPLSYEEEIQELKNKVQTLTNKLQVLTNFNGLSLPLNKKNEKVTYAELQEELDILTDSRYEVVENSFSNGQSMGGLNIGSVSLRDRQTNEQFRVILTFNSSWDN